MFDNVPKFSVSLAAALVEAMFFASNVSHVRTINEPHSSRNYRYHALPSLQPCPSHDLILPISVKLLHQLLVVLSCSYQAFGNFG